MKKKLLCLVLALLMVVPMLASCSNDDDAVQNITDKASRYTTTLNMWVMTSEEGVDPDQAAAVNEAINKITKSKFKTKLNIKYVKESEYYAAVEEALAEHQYALKNGLISKEGNNTEETVYNEYGVPELKYPEIDDFYVDILFVGNYEKYREYAKNGWLLDIDGKLADDAMVLSTYIDETLLGAAMYDGLTYGVPNNHPMGEYTYLLLDKDLMNDYYYSANSFPTSSIYDDNFQAFLQYVYDENKTKILANDADATYPLFCEDGTVDLSFVHYWSFDLDTAPGHTVLKPNEFSLFGGTYLNTTLRGEKISYDSILGNAAYANRVQTKLKFEKTEGYITTNPAHKTAAKIVNGSWEEKAAYEAEGYEVLIMGTPRIDEEDVFGSMFAIGGSTIADDRAMEIITHLNTDPTFRNLLQYGIENVNYTVETETIDEVEYQYAQYTEDNKYWLDLEKTGNMMIAYPNCKEDIMRWEYAKKQNFEAIGTPTLSAYLNMHDYKLDTDSVRIINAMSAKMKAYLDANVYDESVSLADAQARFNAISSNMKGSAANVAAYLIGLFGENVSYKDGADGKVTLANLTQAITLMGETEVKDKEGVLESPHALYLEWRESSGVIEDLPTVEDTPID